MNTHSQATRRNFRLSVMNGAIMNGSFNSVSSPDLVLTAFAAYLTGNPLLLGLIAPIRQVAWFLPQMWIIGRIQRTTRALPIYRRAALLRVSSWIMLTSTVLLVRDHTALLLVILGFVIAEGLASGLAGLPFIEVIGKIIPARQRGLVFGWRGALGGIIAVVGSQVVLLLTGPDAQFDFPLNYGLLFVVAGISQIAGVLSFALVCEPDADDNTTRSPLSPGVLIAIWRSDTNFRRYVLGRTLFVLSSIAQGLVIVFANQVLGVRLEMAGLYLFVSSLLYPMFSIAAGRISLRIGNKVPLAAGLLAQGAGWALLLLAIPLGVEDRAAEYYLILVYALGALQKGLVISTTMALGLNVTPETEHALYMGALNTWLGIVSFAGLLSGVIAKVIGFEALFALTLVCACLGAGFFLTLHEEWEGQPDSP
ncbi:MAG: MFS transporter [Anaerolineae bacterium]|nr:MFS transporter [Anaerolineae bacterium]